MHTNALNTEGIRNLLLRHRLKSFRIIMKRTVRVVEIAKWLNGPVAACDHSVLPHPKVLRTNRQQILYIARRGRLTVHVIFLQLSSYDNLLIIYPVFLNPY